MVAAHASRISAEPRPVYVIHGPDSFLLSERWEQVLSRLLGDERDGMAVVDFDGETASLADVLDECRTGSLLCPIRIIRVGNADKFVTEHRKSLEAYLQSPSPTGVLVLICRTWPKSTRLYKLVAKVGENLDCEPPKRRAEIVGWARDRARSGHGCTLSSSTSDRLVELVGDDLGLLNMELAKLSTYVAPSKEIGLEDVEELVGASRAEKVFGITDAIAGRDAEKALALWDQVLATDRGAPYRAVGGLAYGFRRMAEAKRLVASGMSIQAVKSRLRIWSDSSSLSRQLDRFSVGQWRDHLGRLLQIDLGAKTGLGTVNSSVEKLIVELCSAS